MIWRASLLALTLLAPPALGDTVVPSRTIRANTMIQAADLAMITDTITGMVNDPSQLVGLEARKNLYANRPIRASDVGPPALIDRNQIVTLIFQTSGLSIVTEGRAMGRAGAGERLRVLNLSSRKTVSGYVDHTGAVRVGQ